ncbi:MAG: hypothetical protein JNM43_23770 [Planctomycetaceae bacterium]|nr:hypothetical protein [Planctomycetaceae bacterium]
MTSRSILNATWLPFLCTAILMNVSVLSAVAKAGDEETPEFHQRLAEDRVNFIYISDLAPVVRRFLESDAGVSLVNGISGGSQDAGDLLQSFESEAIDIVPEQICFAQTKKSMYGVSRAVPLGMYMALCVGAVQSGETEALEELHPKLLESLKAFKLEQIDLWIRFRSESIPSVLETALDELSAELGEDSAVKLEYVDGELNFTARVRDFMPPQLLIGTLFATGLSDDLSDPDLKEASEVIGDLELLIRIQRVGSAFHFRIGEVEAEPEKLLDLTAGELWKNDESQLMFMRYDSNEFAGALKEAQEAWNKYADSPLGAAVKELDTEDLLGDLETAVRQIGPGDAKGEVRMMLAEQLTIDAWHSGQEPGATISESGIADFIPKSATTWSLQTEASLADTLQAYLSAVEDRLASKSMQEQFGTSRRSSVSFVELSEQYYERLGEFRRVLRNELHAVFSPPTAIVCGGARDPLTIETRFFERGENNVVTLNGIPVPRLAMITRLSEGQDAAAAIEKAKGALLKAFEMEGDVKIWDETKIDGLDYPAYSFSGDWQKGRLPKEIEVHCEGECLPHCVMLPGGWIILSTSPALTREICEARKEESNRHKFSATQLKASELDFGDRDALNNTIFFPIQLIRDIVDGKVELTGEGDTGTAVAEGLKTGLSDSSLNRLFQAFTVLGSQISEMSMEAHYENGVRRMHVSFSFAE